MTVNGSSDSETTDIGIRHLLRVEKPTIKILLYTDDPHLITNGDNLLGLASMIERLRAHEPASADFGVGWVSRSSSVTSHADNKIDVVLQREVDQTGKPFDEIWFFGMHQITTQTFSLGPFGGGRQSELDERERATLARWMDANDVGGGVLIAGDHSAKRPDGAIVVPQPACPDKFANEKFLALGRALGRCVPRAGLIRKWAGGPTSDPLHSTNTVAASGLQHDPQPQQLTLRPVDKDGKPDPSGRPHPLFFYRDDSFINVLPDHTHEGALVDVFEPNAWPSKPGQPQPLPHVIALGVNQRDATMFNLISAYDGDSAGVGRIVADSSWHHYLNINLINFPHPAAEHSASDKIGQFYGNLGLWLAPLKKRNEMAHWLFWELANFSLVMGEGGDFFRLGTLAYSTLLQVASPCEIYELVSVLVSDAIETASFDMSSLSESRLAAVKMLMGGVLNSYHEEMTRARRGAADYTPLTVDAVIKSGLQTATQLIATNLGTKPTA